MMFPTLRLSQAYSNQSKADSNRVPAPKNAAVVPILFTDAAINIDTETPARTNPITQTTFPRPEGQFLTESSLPLRRLRREDPASPRRVQTMQIRAVIT